MSDLISRSALLEKLEELIEYDTFDIYKEEPLINISWETLEDIISNQPTAYDVDKVVEDLEKLKKYEANGDCPKEGMCRKQPYECTSCYTTTAIEIVKGGGVNE